MLRILESQFISDFTDSFSEANILSLAILIIFPECIPERSFRFPFNQIAEIVG